MAEDPQRNFEHQSTSIHKTEEYWCTSMIQQLEQSDLPYECRLGEKIKNCAQYRRYGLKSEKKPNYCHVRYLCNYCSKADIRQAVEDHANSIFNLMIQSDLCPIFMTLSPRPGIDLVQQLDQVEKILGRIRQQRKNHFSRGTRFSEFCRFQSALVFLEVKRTDDESLWFPHVHAIVLNPLLNVRFNQPDLNVEWMAISGSEVPPHVKTTTPGNLFRRWQPSGSIPDEIKDKILRNLRRLIRYALKPLRLCPADLIAVHSAMFRRKRIREWTTRS